MMRLLLQHTVGRQWMRPLGLMAIFALCTQAQAGLFDDEEARKAILDLRQKVEANHQATQQRITTEVQALRSEGALLKTENAALIELLKKGLLDLQAQIEQLRTDMAKLRGQDELLAKDLSELQRKQRDITQGVEERLRRFDPVKVTSEGKEFTADPAEVKEYEAALALFRKGDFKNSQQAWLDFLRRYPQSGYGPVSLYWLANTQFVTRDYKEAITNFKTMTELLPDSPKAPEAMLAIGNSQAELKDVRAARKAYDDLIKIYPQSEAAVAAKDRLSRLK